jgi:type III secretion system YscD/HrpQ family protein
MSVSRNHARLSVNADGMLEIEDLGSKNGTVVNGAVIEGKRDITPQDLVAMGTTVFMIIDREAPQETIYSPATPSFEAKEPVPEEVVQVKRDWKKEPIPMKYLVAAGSFAAMFLVIFLSFFSLFKPEGTEVAHTEHVSEIKDALAKFEDVQYSYNPGSGKLFLTGHVLTGVDYQELQYRISQIPFVVTTENNVVIDEGVWKSMNDVLSQNANWRGVSIYATKPGRFVANGYVENAQQATALSEYLTVNFPYLDRLDNKVVVQDVLNTELQGLLTAQNLGAVTFQLANGEVILSGRYNEDKKSDYEALVKKINSLNGVHSVKDYAIATHPNLARIDLSANYQVTGSALVDHHGFSAVINGKIYTVGDHVDGMAITAIDPNSILLEKDGLKYKIDYVR